MIYKKLVPSSLLGRSLIIVFIPIITLVILTSLVFYQTSWNIISKRLTQSVVADINVIVNGIPVNPQGIEDNLKRIFLLLGWPQYAPPSSSGPPGGPPPCHLPGPRPPSLRSQPWPSPSPLLSPWP